MRLVFDDERTRLYQADCLAWLREQPKHSIQAVVTDPPYGLIEYSDEQMTKRRNGKGGVWRIPPSFGGSKRAPLPRFTVLSDTQTEDLYRFFLQWGKTLLPALTPGAYVMVASMPLLADKVSRALTDAGFEFRGEIIRLVQTLRGGDRPKGAEEEFPMVSAMPRGAWEPWVLMRRPLDGTLADTLRKWGTGGLRRLEDGGPFVDVIPSQRTPRTERRIANHPSLKPQAFLRQIVRAALPLGEGVVLDTFAGSGSTLAAARHVGYESVGVELSEEYAGLAASAIPQLAALGAPDGRSDGEEPLSNGVGAEATPASTTNRHRVVHARPGRESAVAEDASSGELDSSGAVRATARR